MVAPRVWALSNCSPTASLVAILLVSDHAMQLLQQHIATLQEIAQNMAFVTANVLTNSKLCCNTDLVRPCNWQLQQDMASVHNTAQNTGYITTTVSGI